MAILRKVLMIIDDLAGLRAWGLILYGALPATFSLLGAKEVKINVEAPNIIYALIASPLPIIILYLLIKTKCRAWYLSKRHLYWRSLITAFMILLASTAICLLAGVIKGNFTFSDVLSTNYIYLAKSFLLAIVSLVLSSILFMGILIKGSQLPLIPGKKLVDSLSDFKKFKREFGSSSIWNEHNLSETRKQIQAISDILECLENIIVEAGYFIRLSLNSLKDELEIVRKYLNDINGDDDTALSYYEAYFREHDIMKSAAAKDLYNNNKNEIQAFRILKIKYQNV
ncbi:MAG: hypothetical protein GY839_06185 [candidate division Zixibacteria bacterium]|nr:hypothetical protein [candidate division Zixibacteria bacterium]